MTKLAKRIIFLCASISFLLGLFTQYVGVYYHTDIELIDTYNAINVDSKMYDGMITYGSKKSKVGIVFYPGGKVEYTAYEPLMKKLAEKGFFCVLLEMPYNLAVFGINSADGIIDSFPGVGKWYMMGHSLGGSMAGTYLADNYRDYEGLILLASYVTNDLTHTNLNVISISFDAIPSSISFKGIYPSISAASKRYSTSNKGYSSLPFILFPYPSL